MSIRGFIKLIKGLRKLYKGLVEAYKFYDGMMNNWGDFEEKAKSVSRSMGLVKEQADAMNTAIINALSEDWARKYGASLDDVYESMESVVRATGRITLMTKEAQENMLALRKLVDPSTIESMVAEMDKYGASIETTQAYLTLAYEKASQLGLDAKKTSEVFAKNMGKLSTFGFKNGVSDIMKMTMWSQKLKVNFDSIAEATKNFSDIENSIKNSAQIQLLGGTMSMNYSNPLEVMSEAMFDADAFGRRIADTVANMGTFDKESGTIRIESWLDRAKLQKYASALNMSVEDLTNMANQQEKLRQINASLDQRLTEEQRTAIANMAEFDLDAQSWVIKDTQGNKYDVASIHNAETLEQIAQNTISKDRDINIQNIAGHVAQINESMRGRSSDMLSYKESLKGMETARKAADARTVDEKEWFRDTMRFTKEIWTEIYTSKVFQEIKFFTGGFFKGAKGFTGGKFEKGGIIGGPYPEGDQLLARVNSGEMVLNKEQQRRLFNLANGAEVSNPLGESIQSTINNFNDTENKAEARYDNATNLIDASNRNTSENIARAMTTSYEEYTNETTNVINEGNVANNIQNEQMVDNANTEINSNRVDFGEALTNFAQKQDESIEHFKESVTTIKDNQEIHDRNVSQSIENQINNFDSKTSQIVNSGDKAQNAADVVINSVETPNNIAYSVTNDNVTDIASNTNNESISTSRANNSNASNVSNVDATDLYTNVANYIANNRELAIGGNNDNRISRNDISNTIGESITNNLSDFRSYSESNAQSTENYSAIAENIANSNKNIENNESYNNASNVTEGNVANNISTEANAFNTENNQKYDTLNESISNAVNSIISNTNNSENYRAISENIANVSRNVSENVTNSQAYENAIANVVNGFENISEMSSNNTNYNNSTDNASSIIRNVSENLANTANYKAITENSRNIVNSNVDNTLNSENSNLVAETIANATNSTVESIQNNDNYKAITSNNKNNIKSTVANALNSVNSILVGETIANATNSTVESIQNNDNYKAITSNNKNNIKSTIANALNSVNSTLVGETIANATNSTVESIQNNANYDAISENIANSIETSVENNQNSSIYEAMAENLINAVNGDNVNNANTYNRGNVANSIVNAQNLNATRNESNYNENVARSLVNASNSNFAFENTYSDIQTRANSINEENSTSIANEGGTYTSNASNVNGIASEINTKSIEENNVNASAFVQNGNSINTEANTNNVQNAVEENSYSENTLSNGGNISENRNISNVVSNRRDNELINTTSNNNAVTNENMLEQPINTEQVAVNWMDINRLQNNVENTNQDTEGVITNTEMANLGINPTNNMAQGTVSKIANSDIVESNSAISNRTFENITSRSIGLEAISTNIGIKPTAMQGTQIESKPIVGAPTLVAPPREVSASQSSPIGGNITLNIGGTLKLDASSFGGKSIQLDLASEFEKPAIKNQLMRMIAEEFSKVNGKQMKDSQWSKAGNLLGFNQV